MKNNLFTLIFLFFGVFGFSQGVPCTVANGINSGTIQVQLFASPMRSCQPGCATATFCVFPGQVISIPPCGPDFFEWTYAVVTPTTDDCSTPCPSTSVTVVSPTGCLPATASSVHCHAGPYTSTFVGPNTLVTF